MMRYIRKEGINRDNSRLGVFEMTAIRGTRSPSPWSSSLLAGRSLGVRTTNSSATAKFHARVWHCAPARKAKRRLIALPPLRAHAPAFGSACDQFSVPRARKFGRYRLGPRRLRGTDLEARGDLAEFDSLFDTSEPRTKILAPSGNGGATCRYWR